MAQHQKVMNDTTLTKKSWTAQEQQKCHEWHTKVMNGPKTSWMAKQQKSWIAQQK